MKRKWIQETRFKNNHWFFHWLFKKNVNDIDFIVLTIVQELLNLEMVGSLKMAEVVEVWSHAT